MASTGNFGMLTETQRDKSHNRARRIMDCTRHMRSSSVTFVVPILDTSRLPFCGLREEALRLQQGERRRAFRQELPLDLLLSHHEERLDRQSSKRQSFAHKISTYLASCHKAR